MELYAYLNDKQYDHLSEKRTNIELHFLLLCYFSSGTSEGSLSLSLFGANVSWLYPMYSLRTVTLETELGY